MSAGHCVLIALCVACACAASGCAGNGDGLDANGRPIDEGGGTNTPLTPDFASIQAHVFTPICSVCHVGAGAPQGLRLDAASSYALLVGVPSTEVPSILRVKPGDPANSYIMQKLQGIAAVGARMPFGEPALPASTLAVISQWISDGAQPATASTPVAVPGAAGGAAFTVSTVVPAAKRLIVGFSQDLDTTRLASHSLALRRLDADASAGGDLPVDIAAVPANARVVVVTPRAPLVPGRYALIIDADPDRPLADTAGRMLAPEHGVRIDFSLNTTEADESP